MPNSYFQFKQFTTQQDKCAMKVTTDGCLFGAIVAQELSGKNTCRVLDIGTGTGLLSLMVAQKNDVVTVNAVEIDEAAAGQARENVATSPWNNRVQVIQADILQYEPPFKYNYIICNPPFYEQQLSSPKTGRQLAHHSSGLTLQQLFGQMQNLLKEDGKFYVLLPFYRNEEAVAIAKNYDLFVEQQWQVRQTPKHHFFRSIIFFGKKKTAIQSRSEITIRNEAGDYTEVFTEMLQPFYLHLQIC